MEKLVAKWKGLHVASKRIEPELKSTREAVKTAIVDAGVKVVVTSLGTIALQTQKRTDWEALARKFLHPAIIEGIRDQFVSESEVYVTAPNGWAAEAATAYELPLG